MRRGRGGRHPGAPSPRRWGGGAATLLAPGGAAGEEVSVCEPAAARGPKPGGRGPRRAGESGGGEGRDSDRTLCSVPVRPEREKREEWGQGGGRGGRAPVWRAKTPAVPFLPGAPDVPYTVSSFICSLTYCCEHPTQSHRGTHSNGKCMGLSPCEEIIITPGAQRHGKEGGVQGTEGGSVWLRGECVEGLAAR